MNELTRGAGRFGAIVLQGGVYMHSGAGAPTSGSSGTLAGKAAPGSFYFDYTNAGVYMNTGTKTSPTWTGVTGVGDGALATAEVSVSSAELLALRAAPKTLVAAPGAGKVLEFISALLIYDSTATAYVVGTNDLAIRYKDASSDIISATIDTAGFLDQTSDIMQQVMPLITDNKAPKADCENQPLVLHNTGAGELTTGTGVVRVKISYRRWATGW